MDTNRFPYWSIAVVWNWIVNLPGLGVFAIIFGSVFIWALCAVLLQDARR